MLLTFLCIILECFLFDGLRIEDLLEGVHDEVVPIADHFGCRVILLLPLRIVCITITNIIIIICYILTIASNVLPASIPTQHNSFIVKSLLLIRHAVFLRHGSFSVLLIIQKLFRAPLPPIILIVIGNFVHLTLI